MKRYITYAIKWSEKIKVTSKNINSLDWYQFITEPLDDKTSSLYNMTLQEVIDSEETFSDIGLSNTEIWELLSQKFFEGNVYKELQLHRIVLDKLVRVVLKWETLSEDDLLKISELESMNKQVKDILKKF